MPSRTPARTVIRGGLVAAGADELVPADVAIEGDVIVAIGALDRRPDDVEIDAAGRVLLPGFIDAHCHADATIFDADVQLAFLRQGVTSIIAGQDGVSYAPGSGAWATDYFGALNGAHPSYRGGGVAALLAGYDGTTALNAAYLVPLGTVRHEVMGMSSDPANPDQLAAMQGLVRQGLSEGAVGVSSGLDYVPGIHADAAELAAMCREVAAADGVYVTHMRGGYEEKSMVGTDEIARIIAGSVIAGSVIAGSVNAGSGVRAHISHYHGEPALLTGLIDDLLAGGADVSYDSYFYLRGFTLAAMPLLPPRLLSGDRLEVAASLRDPATRDWLLTDWFPEHARTHALGAGWPDQMTLAHIQAPEFAWAHGLTIAAAAHRAGLDPQPFILDLLSASDLQATAVMAPQTTRDDDAMVPLFTHPAMVGGSDGISLGAHPHPRAFGNFAKYLRELVVVRGAWSWSDAAQHLASKTALVHAVDAADPQGRAGRGSLRPGLAADVVLIDPDRVRDRASYDRPRELSEGIDDVFVNGVQVLQNGALTGATPGRGLRRRSS